MKTSETLDKLAAALSAAQGAFTSPEKNRDVDVQSEKARYSFGYATLDAVLDMARPHLTANGLSFVQTVDEEAAPLPDDPINVIPRLTTRLMHASGQWIEGSVRMQIERGGNQGVGSAITYMRRYGLMAILGICSATDDDDGNAADGNKAQFRDRQQGQRQQHRQEERREAPKGQVAPATGAARPATLPPVSTTRPTTAPTGSAPTTDRRPQVMDVTSVDTKRAGCEAWYQALAELTPKGFDAIAWKHTGSTWQLRFDSLRDMVLACETIRKALGQKAGGDRIGSILGDFSWDDPEGVQAIRKELVRASLGEVAPSTSNVGA